MTKNVIDCLTGAFYTCRDGQCGRCHPHHEREHQGGVPAPEVGGCGL